MEDQILHHFMQDLTPIIVLSVGTVAAAWVIGKIIGAFRHRAQLRAQAELHNRLLEKFSSAGEFTAYLQSAGGRGFFENLAVESAAPLSKILSSIKAGTILTTLGAGFFILAITSKTEDAANALFIVCTVALALGIGFLISSAISYRLAKNWGIIPADKNQIPTQTASTTA